MVTILSVFATALTAALLTHELSQKKNWGTIRSSSFLTLAFALVTSLFHYKLSYKLQLVFLGGSFVGMSDPKKLNRYQISTASAFFSFIFLYFISFLKGFGGALGLSAFLSCLSVNLITHTGRKTRQVLRKRRKLPA
mgnify:CR=1 FL=1